MVCLPGYLPAGLPAIRPTSGGSIAIFSCEAEYWYSNTDLLLWLRFIHCSMISPFILHCFFPIERWKMWEITKDVSMNCNDLHSLSHAKGQMLVYVIILSIKIINKYNIFILYLFKSVKMVSHWDLCLYICFYCAHYLLHWSLLRESHKTSIFAGIKYCSFQ